MEHSVSDEVGDAMCRMLNAPARCPGGKLIYPCEKEIATCNECQDAADSKDQAKSSLPRKGSAHNRSATLPERNHRSSSRGARRSFKGSPTSA